MNRLFATALSLALLAAAAPPAMAATKKHAPSPKAAAAKASAPAPVDEPLNDAELAAANRVFTGHADCEFKQAVDITPVGGHPGHFDVHFGKLTYHMVPEETSTGAVRLHDKQADVVWLQIPLKSMLMDNKAGHRLVDACQLPQQRAAVEAAAQARVAADAASAAAQAASTAATAATAAASAAAAAVPGAASTPAR